MRRRIPVLRMVVAVAVLGAALGMAGLGAVSGASTQDACDTINNDNASNADNGSSTSRDDAKTLAKTFKSAASDVSGGTKAAMNTIANFYDKIGKAGTNAARVAVVGALTRSYVKAWAKFTKWYLANCIVIPTIPSISIPTIPSISIPTIPTISIPTVPTTAR